MRPIELIADTLRGDRSWLVSEAIEGEALAQVARAHGVERLLWYALRDTAPDVLLAPLARDLAAEVARSAIRDRELARVLGSCASFGVDAVVFKGAALAHTCYEHAWLRTRLDTDILVPEEAFDRAAAALVEAGYTRSTAISTGAFVSHQVVFERVDGYGLEHLIDLHRKVLNPQMLAGTAAFSDLRADAQTIPLHGATLHVPSPVWSALLGCAHRLVHHQHEERLIWVCDIDRLARKFTDDDWRQFVSLARDRQCSAVCADGLAAAARLIGTPLPPAMLTILVDAGRLDPSRRYIGRAVRRLDVLRDDLGRLPRWRDRLRLLREHAFPSPSFMRHRYQARSGALLPLLYAHRLVSGAFKWMRI